MPTDSKPKNPNKSDAADAYKNYIGQKTQGLRAAGYDVTNALLADDWPQHASTTVRNIVKALEVHAESVRGLLAAANGGLMQHVSAYAITNTLDMAIEMLNSYELACQTVESERQRQHEQQLLEEGERQFRDSQEFYDAVSSAAQTLFEDRMAQQARADLEAKRAARRKGGSRGRTK